jgi:hypothetical protein
MILCVSAVADAKYMPLYPPKSIKSICKSLLQNRNYLVFCREGPSAIIGFDKEISVIINNRLGYPNIKACLIPV